MKNNWGIKKLIEFANVTMGQSPKSSSYNETKEGIRFYQGVTEYKDKYIGLKTYTTEPTKVVPANTILFSVRAPVGEVNITTSKCCIGRGNAGLNMKNGNNEFLYYLLKASKRYIQQNSTGTVYDSISGEILKNIVFNIPDDDGQKSIAAILSSLDDKIELLREQNKTLESIAQTIFKEWFVNFNFPDENGKPYKDNGGEMVESELGMIPKGWKVSILGEEYKLTAGGDKPDTFSSIKNDQHNIPIYSNGISEDGLYGFTNNPRITTESVTVSARGTIGFVCLRSEPYFPIVRLISVTPIKKRLSSKYIYYYLVIENIQGSGTTQQQLTVPAFSNTKILIPDETIIKEFTDFANVIHKKIDQNKMEIRLLSDLLTTILPKLINGEISVNG